MRFPAGWAGGDQAVPSNRATSALPPDHAMQRCEEKHSMPAQFDPVGS